MKFSRMIRVTAMLLIPAVFYNSPAFAAKKPVDPAAMKAKVEMRGVGNGVKVTFADNTEVNGLIISIGDQGFSVKTKRADQPQEIQYAQLTGVYKDKASTGEKVGIVVAVAGVAIVITVLVFAHLFRTSFPKTIPI
jgi:hypothetical protein